MAKWVELLERPPVLRVFLSHEFMRLTENEDDDARTSCLVMTVGTTNTPAAMQSILLTK